MMQMRLCAGRRVARTLRLGLAAELAVLGGICAVFCPVAAAGTYLMNTCNVPGRPAAALAPWHWQPAPNVSPVDSCARGGGFGFYFGGVMSMPRGAGAAMALWLAPDSPISIRRVRLWIVGRLAGTGSGLFVGTNAGAADGQATNSHLFDPPGGEAIATPHETSLLPLGTNWLRVLLYCSHSAAAEDCYPSSRSVLEVIGAEVTLLESVAPSVTVTAPAGGDPGATRTVHYSARDEQSGIESVELLIDGAMHARKDFAAECQHADFAACPKTRSDELVVNAGSLTNGAHRLRLRATDAAGNSAQSPAQTIEVDNQGPPAANAGASSERSPGGRVTASFAATSKRTLTVSYGSRPRVRGRLINADGRPVARASISIAETLPGRAPSVATIGQTRDDGTFAFRLRSGATRTVRVQYASAGGVVAAPALRLKVRAAATLAVALNGVRVRYRGNVLARPIPSRGVVVRMQGRRKGGTWQSFASHRVRRAGRVAGTYRLRVRRPGVVLQFRAVIAKAPGYPYEAGASPVVTRTVR